MCTVSACWWHPIQHWVPLAPAQTCLTPARRRLHITGGCMHEVLLGNCQRHHHLHACAPAGAAVARRSCPCTFTLSMHSCPGMRNTAGCSTCSPHSWCRSCRPCTAIHKGQAHGRHGGRGGGTTDPGGDHPLLPPHGIPLEEGHRSWPLQHLWHSPERDRQHPYSIHPARAPPAGPPTSLAATCTQTWGHTW
jgi:hypothetical protein